MTYGDHPTDHTYPSVRTYEDGLREAARVARSFADAQTGEDERILCDSIVAMIESLITSPPVGDGLTASSVCPVCGLDEPHAHGGVTLEQAMQAKADSLARPVIWMLERKDDPLTRRFVPRDEAERFVANGFWTATPLMRSVVSTKHTPSHGDEPVGEVHPKEGKA